MANMALLAMVDIAYRGRVWEPPSTGQARTAAIAIALTAMAVLAIQHPFGLSIGWLGIESVIIVVAFLSLVAWTRRSAADERAGSVGPRRGSTGSPTGPGTTLAVVRPSIRRDLLMVAGAALVVLVAAPFLVMSAEGIATRSGLGQTFVGASFLAVATSLPELSTALMAVRIGAVDLAVGSLLGSNAFNIVIIAIADLAYTGGAILAAVSPQQAFVGVGAILLMALVVASLVHGSRTRTRRLEPGSWMVLLVYLLLMYVIWGNGS